MLTCPSRAGARNCRSRGPSRPSDWPPTDPDNPGGRRRNALEYRPVRQTTCGRRAVGTGRPHARLASKNDCVSRGCVCLDRTRDSEMMTTTATDRPAGVHISLNSVVCIGHSPYSSSSRCFEHACYHTRDDSYRYRRTTENAELCSAEITTPDNFSRTCKSSAYSCKALIMTK